MSGPRIVALGEVLWDLLPSGPLLGGAPANFAFHAAALGAETWLISRVGDDRRGHEILQRTEAAGLPRETLQLDAEAPTGTVSVELGADGQPRYVIHEDVAWDRLALLPEALAAVGRADAVCFGSLAQRSAVSRETIRSLVAAAPLEALRIFDINLRQEFYAREVIESSLALANVLKLNDAELPVLAEMFRLAGEPQQQLAALAGRFDLRVVALTRGAQGSVLWRKSEISEHPGVPITVRDTIGAGDAFTAVLAIGLLAEWPLDFINERASSVGAFVASQSGATPILPVMFRDGPPG